MLISLTGDTHMTIYGLKVRKILLPFAYLLFSQIVAPNADMIGHLSGIIAAVIFKYCGLYSLRLLP